MVEGSDCKGADLTLGLTYARWRRSRLGRITDALEQRLLLELLGEVRDRRVLDVGCGDGALAIELWRRGARVSGIDASSQMIAAARGRAAREGADIVFSVATSEALPLPSGMFDRVLAVTMLCFDDDPGRALREITRVLRPGGRLVIGELGRWSIWAATRRLRGRFGHPVWGRARFRSAGELRDLLHGAGLTIVDLRGAVFYPPCAVAAAVLRWIDHPVGRITTLGAAFLALAADKAAAG